jgi:hypothetical protein
MSALPRSINPINHINKIFDAKYKNKPSSYSDLYGSDVAVGNGIIFIFAVIITYYYIKNHMPKIKADWENKRCNPLYMPFAHLVKPDKTKTKYEIISANFGQCIHDVLYNIADDALAPLYYSKRLATKNINKLYDVQVELGPGINNLASNATNISDKVISKAAAVITPYVENSVIMKDNLLKMQAVFKTGEYVAITNYLIIKKLFLALPIIFGLLLGFLIFNLGTSWAWFPLSLPLIFIILALIVVVTTILVILIIITHHLK